jgi:hypothetical protein
VHRDAWDWVVAGAAVAGGAGAVGTAIGVASGALRFRRRPEVRITWATGDDDVPWPKDEVIELVTGCSLEVKVAIRNVGDATGETSISNIVAADCFELRTDKTRGQASYNPIAGRHTGGRVTFLQAEQRFLTGLTWMQSFELVADRALPGTEHEVVFVFVGDRLNRRGVRWLKSRTRPLDEQSTKRWERRRIRALPKGDVVCWPGYRRSTRTVRVVGPWHRSSSSTT